jgi:hypothetical protein
MARAHPAAQVEGVRVGQHQVEQQHVEGFGQAAGPLGASSRFSAAPFASALTHMP